MAAPKKSSGPSSKGPQRLRMLNGKQVKPTRYDGPYGKFMAATLNDQIIRDNNGRPLEFRQTGKLEWV